VIAQGSSFAANLFPFVTKEKTNQGFHRALLIHYVRIQWVRLEVVASAQRVTETVTRVTVILKYNPLPPHSETPVTGTASPIFNLAPFEAQPAQLRHNQVHLS